MTPLAGTYHTINNQAPLRDVQTIKSKKKLRGAVCLKNKAKNKQTNERSKSSVIIIIHIISKSAPKACAPQVHKKKPSLPQKGDTPPQKNPQTNENNFKRGTIAFSGRTTRRLGRALPRKSKKKKQHACVDYSSIAPPWFVENLKRILPVIKPGESHRPII